MSKTARTSYRTPSRQSLVDSEQDAAEYGLLELVSVTAPVPATKPPAPNGTLQLPTLTANGLPAAYPDLHTLHTTTTEEYRLQLLLGVRDVSESPSVRHAVTPRLPHHTVHFRCVDDASDTTDTSDTSDEDSGDDYELIVADGLAASMARLPLIDDCVAATELSPVHVEVARLKLKAVKPLAEDDDFPALHSRKKGSKSNIATVDTHAARISYASVLKYNAAANESAEAGCRDNSNRDEDNRDNTNRLCIDFVAPCSPSSTNTTRSSSPGTNSSAGTDINRPLEKPAFTSSLVIAVDDSAVTEVVPLTSVASRASLINPHRNLNTRRHVPSLSRRSTNEHGSLSDAAAAAIRAWQWVDDLNPACVLYIQNIPAMFTTSDTLRTWIDHYHQQRVDALLRASRRDVSTGAIHPRPIRFLHLFSHTETPLYSLTPLEVELRRRAGVADAEDPSRTCRSALLIVHRKCQVHQVLQTFDGARCFGNVLNAQAGSRLGLTVNDARSFIRPQQFGLAVYEVTCFDPSFATERPSELTLRTSTLASTRTKEQLAEDHNFCMIAFRSGQEFLGVAKALMLVPEDENAEFASREVTRTFTLQWLHTDRISIKDVTVKNIDIQHRWQQRPVAATHGSSEPLKSAQSWSSRSSGHAITCDNASSIVRLYPLPKPVGYHLLRMWRQKESAERAKEPQSADTLPIKRDNTHQLPEDAEHAPSFEPLAATQNSQGNISHEHDLQYTINATRHRPLYSASRNRKQNSHRRVHPHHGHEDYSHSHQSPLHQHVMPPFDMQQQFLPHMFPFMLQFPMMVPPQPHFMMPLPTMPPVEHRPQNVDETLTVTYSPRTAPS